MFTMEAREFRAIRLKLKWTQAKLAARLGVSVRAIKHYEAGTRRISPTVSRLVDRVRRKGPHWKGPGGGYVARNDIRTPPHAGRFLFETISAKYDIRSVFDPCAGDGRLLRPWRRAGCQTRWWEIRRGRDFFAQLSLAASPDLWVVNPPFNATAYKEFRLGPEAFLQKIFELAGQHQRIALFTPVHFRLNNRTGSRRGRAMRDWPITSIVSLPSDFFAGAEIYAEILLFNMPLLRGHYTLA